RSEIGDDRPPRGVAQGAVRLEGGRVQDQRHALAVTVERVGGYLVEAHDGSRQHVEDRTVGGCGGQPGVQVVQQLLEVSPDDVVLRREVAEERAPRDPGGGGDVVDRGGLEAPCGEQLQCDRLDVVPVGGL